MLCHRFLKNYTFGSLSMEYSLQTRVYHRPFLKPLRTGHGIWTVREGILLCLTDDQNRNGFGEISPLEWFGTETLAEADELCRGFGSRINDGDIGAIAEDRPCCRFAFESARNMLHESWRGGSRQFEVAGLLPGGESALEELTALSGQGYHTFKWKVGVDTPEKEQPVLARLVDRLPKNGRLRLDANGAFNEDQSTGWLRLLERHDCIEFLEQPLPPEHFQTMLDLSRNFKTPIALDESVASLQNLQQAVAEGWAGPLVVKPAILGSPADFIQWSKDCGNKLVFSSVFETGIGLLAGLAVAAATGQAKTAVGFGTMPYFGNDGMGLHSDGSHISLSASPEGDSIEIWNRIDN